MLRNPIINGTDYGQVIPSNLIFAGESIDTGHHRLLTLPSKVTQEVCVFAVGEGSSRDDDRSS